jgi:hypothetical protein
MIGVPPGDRGRRDGRARRRNAQQQSGQNTDHADDDQQLDQRERLKPLFAIHVYQQHGETIADASQ